MKLQSGFKVNLTITQLLASVCTANPFAAKWLYSGYIALYNTAPMRGVSKLYTYGEFEKIKWLSEIHIRYSWPTFYYLFLSYASIKL